MEITNDSNTNCEINFNPLFFWQHFFTECFLKITLPPIVIIASSISEYFIRILKKQHWKCLRTTHWANLDRLIDPVEVVGHPDVDPRLPGRGAPVSVGNNSDKRVSDTRNVFFSMVSSQAPKIDGDQTARPKMPFKLRMWWNNWGIES